MTKEIKNVILIAVGFFLAASGIGYLVYDTNEKVKEVQVKNDALNGSIQGLKSKANTRPQVEKELGELNKNVKEYVKILPSPEIATEEEVIRIFSEYKKRSGITLNEIVNSPPRPGKDFDEKKVTFRITGTYRQFITFLNLIERHENFLQVKSFRLSPAGQIVGVDGKRDLSLSCSLEVSTFRYKGK